MRPNAFLKSNIIYLSSVGLGGFLGYLFQFLVARRLSVGEYGEFQVLTSLMLIFGVFFSAFSYFIIKYSSVLAKNEDRAGQVAFFSYYCQKLKWPVVALAFFFLVLSPLIKNWLDLSSWGGLVIVLAAIFFLYYSGLYQNVFQGWSDFGALGVLGILTVVTKLMSGYLLVRYNPTALSAVGSFLFSALVSFLAAKIYFDRKWGRVKNIGVNWRKKYFEGKDFRKSFIKILFFSLGMAAVNNADILLVKSNLGAEAAGNYGALSVLGKISLWLSLAIIGVILPQATALGEKKFPAPGKSIVISYMLLLAIAVTISGFYFFWPEIFISYLYGEKYLLIAKKLWLFSLSAGGLAFFTLEATLAFAREDYKTPGFIFFSIMTGMSFWFLNISNIGSAVMAVTVCYFCGWLVLFSENMKHRLKHDLKTQKIIE